MRKLKDLHVSELFKEHCNRCIKEDKGKSYNYLQETFANTELFDLSLLNIDRDKYQEVPKPTIDGDKAISEAEFLKGVSLPFEAVFLKLPNTDTDSSVTLFLHEFNPSIVTGSITFMNETNGLAITFHILVDIGKIIVSLDSLTKYVQFLARGVEDMSKIMSYIHTYALRNLHVAIDNLNNLPKHTVVADKTTKQEYYRRKGLPTLKVYKPIYYVMNKKETENSRTFKLIKPLGKLEYTYSFKVRGHWRKINPDTYGKNRNGEYVVKGHTFVKDYVKGEGELVKRVRVLK